MFYHESREIRVVVHGDDFTCLGWREQLNWARAEMMNRYEIKSELMGPAAGDAIAFEYLTAFYTGVNQVWSSKQTDDTRS